MLELLRRQQSKLKWVWIVILAVMIVSFVVAYIPFGDFNTGGSITSDVASVGGESVTAKEFQVAYRNNMRRMGSQISPEMLKAFGFDKQVLDYLISQKVVSTEAHRLGLQVSDAEVQEKVLSNAAFVDGGKFIGHARYQALLEQNSMTIAEFESAIRSQLLSEKLLSFLTAGVRITDKDAEEEFRKKNEKAKLDYFVIDPSKFASKVTVTDQEQKDFYEKNKATYQMPEQRKGKYLFLDSIKFHQQATATDKEIQDYYAQHMEEYRLKETVTAQHILFKTEGKKPEEVEAIRQKALKILALAKKGTPDFSLLAKENSEDSTASNNGFLGEFPRGQMVPEFDKVAFSLGEGAVSDLVKTQFGFHIIKVTHHQQARLRGLPELKEAIRSILLSTKGNEKAAEVSKQVAAELGKNKNLDAIAQKYGLDVRTTKFVSATDKLEELSNSAEFTRQLFSLAKGDIGTPITNDEGIAVPSLIEIQAPHPASFEEAKARVLGDAKADKAKKVATDKTTEIVAAAKNAKDIASLAKLAGIDVKTSDSVARGGQLPDFGAIADRDKEIFSLPVGKVGTPSTVATKTLVFAVKERKDLTPEDVQKGLPAARASLLESKRETYFTNWVQESQKKMQDSKAIKINQAVLTQLADTTR